MQVYDQDVLNVNRDMIEDLKIDWQKVKENQVLAEKAEQQRQREEFVKSRFRASQKTNEEELLEVIK